VRPAAAAVVPTVAAAQFRPKAMAGIEKAGRERYFRLDCDHQPVDRREFVNVGEMDSGLMSFGNSLTEALRHNAI
jgi:hypothetical protein